MSLFKSFFDDANTSLDNSTTTGTFSNTIDKTVTPRAKDIYHQLQMQLNGTPYSKEKIIILEETHITESGSQLSLILQSEKLSTIHLSPAQMNDEQIVIHFFHLIEHHYPDHSKIQSRFGF